VQLLIVAKDQIASSGFKRPEEIPLDEKMVPVSARIPASVAKRLAREAKQSGHPVAKLVAHAVCSYVKFIEKEGE